MVAFEPFQPVAQLGASQKTVGLHRQSAERERVGLTNFVLFTVPAQLFETEFADRLKHGKARTASGYFCRGNHLVLDQGFKTALQIVTNGSVPIAHRRNRVELGATAEGGEA